MGPEEVAVHVSPLLKKTDCPALKLLSTLATLLKLRHGCELSVPVFQSLPNEELTKKLLDACANAAGTEADPMSIRQMVAVAITAAIRRDAVRHRAFVSYTILVLHCCCSLAGVLCSLAC